MLFRAWDNKEKRMVYEGTVAITPHGDVLEVISNGWRIATNRYIVMFSKPKLDKHGRQVYEGDVVKQTAPHMYDVNILIQKDTVLEDSEMCSGDHNDSDFLVEYEYEVIGNIYESRYLRSRIGVQN